MPRERQQPTRPEEAWREGRAAARARSLFLVHLPNYHRHYHSQEALGDHKGKPNASFELGFLENGTFMGYIYIKCGK